MKQTDLLKIPGVGKEMKNLLERIGIHFVEGLAGKDPQELYDQSCIREGAKLDRCVLYVYRCAVYFAEHTEYDSEKLKWWNWKDGGSAFR